MPYSRSRRTLFPCLGLSEDGANGSCDRAQSGTIGRMPLIA